MTRDKFWEIVTTKLVWVDYWNGQEEPNEEVKEILTKSILIPKPKFKVGDKVKWIVWDNAPIDTIEERLYNPDANMWGYLRSDMETFIDETDLELVERKEE